jgi:type IX secretion system PorP/SprF family membrane protein
MKKLLFISVILSLNLLLLHKATAQQLPIYTNYLLNNYAYNPAVAGSMKNLVVNVNYRNQWVGFQDAPSTYGISLHSGLGKEKKAAVGALLSSDNTGLLSKTSGYLTFAYHIKLNNTYKLGLGVSIGMAQYRIKLYDAKTADGGDELLTGNLLSNNVFDSNGGLYFYSDKLFVGFSGFQYLGNKITWKDSKSTLNPHFYLSAGYVFTVSKKISIQPSALLKFSKPVPAQPEFSLRAFYNKLFWIGGSYRLHDATSILAGVTTLKEKLTIAYAYDIPNTKIRTYTSGSHEIVLTYQFIKAKRKLNADEEELNDIDNSIKSKLKKQNEEGTK